MSINWTPHPKACSPVPNGNWLCTVQTGHTLSVLILSAEDGMWIDAEDGLPLSARDIVIAVADVPAPYAPR